MENRSTGPINLQARACNEADRLAFLSCAQALHRRIGPEHAGGP
jgi:hypothetical protein